MQSWEWVLGVFHPILLRWCPAFSALSATPGRRLRPKDHLHVTIISKFQLFINFLGFRRRNFRLDYRKYSLNLVTHTSPYKTAWGNYYPFKYNGQSIKTHKIPHCKQLNTSFKIINTYSKRTVMTYWKYSGRNSPGTEYRTRSVLFKLWRSADVRCSLSKTSYETRCPENCCHKI